MRLRSKAKEDDRGEAGWREKHDETYEEDGVEMTWSRVREEP